MKAILLAAITALSANFVQADVVKMTSLEASVPTHTQPEKSFIQDIPSKLELVIDGVLQKHHQSSLLWNGIQTKNRDALNAAPVTAKANSILPVRDQNTARQAAGMKAPSMAIVKDVVAPVPAAAWLFGFAMVGLVSVSRRNAV